MAGKCKYCGFTGTQDEIVQHASECPHMTDTPDIIETRWGDFVVVKDPRMSRLFSGLVISTTKTHITIKPEDGSSKLKVHRGHVLFRSPGFKWNRGI